MQRKLKYIFITIIGFIFLNPFVCFAQPQIKKTRILFLMDASSSMTYNWNPTSTRFNVASNILLRIIDSIYAVNNEVEFAVRAYGTQYSAAEKNCFDSKLEVPFNYQNVSQIKTRLQYIKPYGFSPIAYSLQQASETELNNAKEYDYSIIFITDGGESCNGDICSVFSKLLQNKISITPYVIGLDKDFDIKTYYACFGNVLQVNNANDIDIAVTTIVNANRKIIEKPKQLKLVTQFSNIPIIKDTIKKVVKTDSIIIPLKTDVALLTLIAKNYSLSKTDKIKLNGNDIKTKKGKATLRFLIDEVAVLKPKIDTPKVERNKTDFSLLLADKYSISKAKSNLTAKNINIKNTKKATLKFEYEEPIVKQTNDFPLLKMNDYVLTFTNKPSLKPTKINQPKNKKATLKFEYEEPIVKETNVFPLLKMNDYVLVSVNKPTLKPTRINQPKNKKATLKFEYEEPVVRVTDVFPLIKTTTTNFLATKKAVIKPNKFSFAKNQKTTLKFEYEEPIKRATDVYPALKIMTTKVLAIKKGVIKPTKFNFPKNLKSTLAFEYEEKKKENLTFIKAANYPKRYSYAYRIPNEKMAFNKSKATLRFTVDVPKPIVKKDTIAKKKPNDGQMNYKTETVASDETKIQIFLVGPDGKQYPKAKPLIEIIDAKTKQPVKSFNRILVNGQPEIHNIPSGDYDIFIREMNVARVYNFHINDKMLNKVMLELEEGTLHFSYSTDLKRPIEFDAVVNRRFANGATIQQKCTQILKYDPGTYYVEINTLPTFKRSFDIEFFKEYVLYLDEPGTLQFTNTNRVGKVQLQCVLGDQFATFYVLDMKGDLAAQKLTIQPGVYKAIFPVDPKLPQAGSKTIDFKIISNQTTSLELK